MESTPTFLQPPSCRPHGQVSTGGQLQTWALWPELLTPFYQFSFSVSPAASCEGLSGSGVGGLGAGGSGTGKTGLGLEQDQGTTSVHLTSLEPFSYPFSCSPHNSFESHKPQCDLRVFPSSIFNPSYLGLRPSSPHCLAVRIWLYAV